VLDEQMMRLSDVMALQPGSRIVLSTLPGATVQLRCGTTTLFEGRVGRRKSRVAVRIERHAGASGRLLHAISHAARAAWFATPVRVHSTAWN
jgi:flagellar motor switch protein FliM